MSANLFENNGIVSMAYRGQTPWHGQGQVIGDNDTDIDIIKKTGFDYSLIPETAGYVNAQGVFVPVAKKVVLRRSDTGAPISVVGETFKVHQPKQILGFFLDFAKTFGLSLETAGVLGGGERYWALARTAVQADLNGNNDPAIMYALLATASDGSMVTRALPTAIRVVCANTWALALNGKKDGSRQSHRSEFSNDKAAKGLGFNLDEATTTFLENVEEIRQLNEVTVDRTSAKGFFRLLVNPEIEEAAVFGADDFARAMGEVGKLDPKRESRGVDGLMEAYTNAPGAKPGTARGLWEASTYFIDHVRGNDDDKRMGSAVFGQGAELKARAWANVRSLALTA